MGPEPTHTSDGPEGGARTRLRGPHALLSTLALVAGILLLGVLTACSGCSSGGPTAPTTGPTGSATTTATTGPGGSTGSTGTTAVQHDPALEATATAFVAKLAAGDFAGAAATFDDTMTTALPADKLKAVWQEVVQGAGAYQGPTATRVQTSGQYRIVFVTTAFADVSLDVKVVYDRSGKVAGLFFLPAQPSAAYEPPAYVDQAGFTERAVTVGSAPWQLPGTLTVPKTTAAGGATAGATGTAATLPAIVLVHGSGPNDRDESVGGAKPFRDLAWGLASKGIVVLRYDKRTMVYAQQMAALTDLTVKQETTDDAVAAAQLLRTQPEVDPKRVFVLGHSLGGTLIPRIGEQLPWAAGFVVLAGAARPLEDLILEQSTYIASLQGTPSAATQQKLDEVKQQVALVKSPDLSPSTPAADLPLGIPATYWLDLRGYQPAAAAVKLPQPLLVLQGARDYQVTTADFALWQAALDGKAGAKLILYPDLNHLFETGTGKSTPAEYQQTGHVDAKVIDDVAAWVGGGK
jgi:dienelactone hydrolase